MHARMHALTHGVGPVYSLPQATALKTPRLLDGMYPKVVSQATRAKWALGESEG